MNFARLSFLIVRHQGTVDLMRTCEHPDTNHGMEFEAVRCCSTLLVHEIEEADPDYLNHGIWLDISYNLSGVR